MIALVGLAVFTVMVGALRLRSLGLRTAAARR